MSDRGNLRALPYVCFFVGSVLSVLVIAAVSWWISTLVDALIMQNARDTGRRLVDAHMLDLHFRGWESAPERKQLIEQLGKDLQSKDYRAEVLALDENTSPDVRQPADEREGELLVRLKHLLDAQPSDSSHEARSAAVEGGEMPPVFVDRAVLGSGSEATRYEYYQPVYWKPNCSICHRALSGTVAPAAEQAAEFDGESTFRVVKISFNAADIERAQSWMRATLLIGAITTMALPLMGMVFAAIMAILVFSRQKS